MSENDNKMHEARFLSLVLSLHGSAWMAMGKVANPMTGKVEKDLEAARGSIDLLETLRIKTQGNLTKEEEKILANALGVLQLNFVDEVARDKDTSQTPNPSPPQGRAAPPDGGENPTPPQEKTAGAQKSDPASPETPSPDGI
jgi:hypothetical protein